MATVRRVMRRTLRIVGSLLAATVVLAACGGDDGGRAAGDRRPSVSSRPVTTRPGSPVPACELLTRADAEAAFGEPVAPGPQRTDECWWSTANDLKTVNLIRRTDDLATWRRGYDNDFWVPNAFGDEGYTGTVLDSIVWRIGDTQYEVNVVFSTRGDPERVVRDLATTAAGRLGAAPRA